MTLRTVFGMLSPAGAKARLSVLIFHRVHARRDALFPREPDAEAFAALVQQLARWCNIMPLDEAIRRLREQTLPPRPLCITFDDGYADNCNVALPVLRRFGVPATFFVATGYLDGGRMWNDTVIESIRSTSVPALDLADLDAGVHALDSVEARQAAIAGVLVKFKYLPNAEREAMAAAVAERASASLPTDLMMTADQVRELHRAGMTMGAHTVTHPILARTADAIARTEIAESKQRLEEIVGERVRIFAYPNGRPRQDYGSAHVQMVRDAGFDAAVSTAWGVASSASDVFQIPRFTPWDNERWRFGIRLAQNLRRTEYAQV
jgi:peptidoglycan/xylan/chitin deacetylase (PgdA/CDA1 family)